MKNREVLLIVLLPIISSFSLILPASAAVPLPDDPSIDHSATALNMPQGKVTPMVAAGEVHMVGLTSDGTVVAAGSNTYGQCDVSSWTNIVQVSAGVLHTVGLRSDGTVVAVGPNRLQVVGVRDWTDITQVAAGHLHTVGLKSRGTAVAVGYGPEQLDVGDWRDIVQVAAGSYHTVGLRSDGTVVAVGSNTYGQCNVADWTDIVQVAAGYIHTVGLKSDGTVVAVGASADGQCDVGDWMDIVQVAAGYIHTVGLKSDGTVVAVGDSGDGELSIGNWANIKQVAAGRSYTVALESDNTVVVVGARLESVEWNLGISTGATLTISSTGGGAVISPGEGSFTYNSGTMVPLVAKPDEGCHFVKWTGDVGGIVDVNATTTIIAMSGNYSVTADFAINWGPIGGIIAGVAAAVLAIFYFRSREADLGKPHP
jgi:alpha-tubulin suppressor-like RCC1 family protein